MVRERQRDKRERERQEGERERQRKRERQREVGAWGGGGTSIQVYIEQALYTCDGVKMDGHQMVHMLPALALGELPHRLLAAGGQVLDKRESDF